MIFNGNFNAHAYSFTVLDVHIANDAFVWVNGSQFQIALRNRFVGTHEEYDKIKDIKNIKVWYR